MEKEFKTEMDSVIALARDYESQRCAIASLSTAINRRYLNDSMLTGDYLIDSCFIGLDNLFREIDDLKKELSKYKAPTSQPEPVPSPDPKSESPRVSNIYPESRDIFDNSGNLLGRIFHVNY